WHTAHCGRIRGSAPTGTFVFSYGHLCPFQWVPLSFPMGGKASPACRFDHAGRGYNTFLVSD
ncbi:MAG: hypothetical protein MSD82_06820, partial [Prevotella sp.]|nr:hypothetical protein [Prevotella sp.]